MRFLVDTQLPMGLARLLAARGHDAHHVSEMPNGNRTSDAEVAAHADSSDRVVVTKDRDFRDGHLLRDQPHRLLIVTTGNVNNRSLLSLFEANLETIVGALEEARFVEIGPGGLVVHDDRPAD